MRAFVITDPDAGEVRELRDPEPGPNEAIVQVSYVGICGTDYHTFRGELEATYPLVPGHEFAGTVAALGLEGGSWREGERVAVDPVLACGACNRCRRGQTNHCEERATLGDPMNGAMAEYVRVPLGNLYRVEAHEPLDEAAFTEPLACVLWGIQRLRVRSGDRALVFGAGPIGALMAQMLDAIGAADVVVADVAEPRLEVARGLGARAAYRVDADLPGRLRERSEGRGFDVVVDCTGDVSVMQDLFTYAAPAARIMFFGVAARGAEIRISPYDVYRNDWEILGSMAINGTFRRARELLAGGRVSVRPLITRVAGLEDVAEILGRPKSAAELKTLIQPHSGPDHR